MAVDILGQRLEGLAAKDVSLDDGEKVIKLLQPKMWEQLYTKHIEAPGSHYGFKLVAVAFGSAIIESLSMPATQAHNISAFAGMMQQYDYPTYYVSKSLLNAMQHTHPPKNLTWADLVYPFPALVFMLPRNALQCADGEVPIMGVARFPVGMSVSVPGTNLKVGGISGVPQAIRQREGHSWNEDRITVFWSTHSGLVSQTVTFPVTQALEPDVDWIDRMSKMYYEYNGMTPDAPTGDFSSYMAGIAANLLLVMQARKQLVEPGGRTGKRHPKTNIPFMRPTFIGRKYEVIRHEHMSEPGAGGRYTELGWRAGHMKVQHYGKDRSETKLILVDPYIAFCKNLVTKESI